MLSSESNFGRFRLLWQCLGGLLLYDLRRNERRSYFLFLSVLRFSPIFGLTPNPAARLALERVYKRVAVRSTDHLLNQA